MGSTVQETIQFTLGETQGNVKATALRLGVSEEAVRQVKVNRPPIDDWVLPQNKTAVISLRDATLKLLLTRVESGDVDNKNLVALARALLDHEVQLRAVTRPAIAIDQRTQHVEITALADKLGELLPELDLRKVIDADVGQ